MQFKDTNDTYGWISIALHWIVLGLLVTQYIISGGMEDGTEASERAATGLHISVGMLAFVFIAWRIIWRLKSGEKPLPPAPPVIGFLSRLVPKLLLLATAVLVISGPLMVWSKGFGLRFFDILTIPTPLPKIEWLHELLEEVHEIAVSVIIGLLILHIVGGLKHLLFDKDGVMQRMLYPKK
jgi:cytochrome b561